MFTQMVMRLKVSRHATKKNHKSFAENNWRCNLHSIIRASRTVAKIAIEKNMNFKSSPTSSRSSWFLTRMEGSTKPTATPSWFPNTPMLQADDTWLGPNQTAATRAGSDRMNTWDAATIDWPMKPSQKRSGCTEKVFTHAPMQVPHAPQMATLRRPWKKKRNREFVELIFSSKHRYICV